MHEKILRRVEFCRTRVDDVGLEDGALHEDAVVVHVLEQRGLNLDVDGQCLRSDGSRALSRGRGPIRLVAVRPSAA